MGFLNDLLDAMEHIAQRGPQVCLLTALRELQSQEDDERNDLIQHLESNDYPLLKAMMRMVVATCNLSMVQDELEQDVHGLKELGALHSAKAIQCFLKEQIQSETENGKLYYLRKASS